MARCDYCGTRILFGGVRDEGLRFCNQKCQQQGYLLAVADHVPHDVMTKYVAEVHQGPCPKCGGPGPIDVHTSHQIWSAVVLTSWQSKPQVCCRACGIKAKLGGTAISSVAGWWGFPWGILMTPIQIGRNLLGIFSSPNPTLPSEQLINIVRLNLAASLVEPASERQSGE